MENTVNTATARAINTTRTAGLETLPQSRSDRFAHLLSDGKVKREEKPSVAASAILGKPAKPRSTHFLNSMDIDQRRSAVEDKEFFPIPAAMESKRGALK
ncbi:MULTISPECIES: hypothetical protein [Pseudomonas syringae group]|uniref:Type III effector n=2 Tax=Pseudomonas syringae group TaxID=136849 RepID=A0ABY1UBV9_PSESX|nr:MULTISPECIES: hypothetical protein [Pseudomonas syringae group]KWT01399.1 hypothetical protein AL046_05505 [Pseudomonas syringae pv. avii]PHN65653.1 hypothetical protein AO286_18815 [Pseudomonas syringae]POQ04723.1 hypothetical protein CXB40_21280 [Pseudomonas syringae pv. avii]RMR17072.1 hypothetical protein ALP89_100610 [Pseudomonas syringae pv. persicae]SOQ13239.1 hypothetical protein CFBP1573P_04409 [Pseudomonas syringae pv. persicae]